MLTNGRRDARRYGRDPPKKMHALFLSPHLDDAAFSCGATVAALPQDTGAEWHCTVATLFTRSVPDPAGFALDCQLDKGVPAGEDYMRLRRAEDGRACEVLGAACVHLDLPEAPHRGYGSAAALFAGVRADDDVQPALRSALRSLYEADPPDLLVLPAGCGNHVDHLQLIAAAAALRDAFPVPTLHYRDTPYIVRDPDAAGVAGDELIAADAGPTLAAKLDACGRYATQLGFQFGGDRRMRRALTDLAAAEAAAAGQFDYAERFARGSDAPPGFLS